MNVLLKQPSPKDSKVLFAVLSELRCTKDNGRVISVSVDDEYYATCKIEYDLGIRFDGTNILCTSTYTNQNVWSEYFYGKGSSGKGNYYNYQPSKEFAINDFYVKNGTIHTTRTYNWNNENYPNSIIEPQDWYLSYNSTHGPIIFYDSSITQA